MIADYFIDGDYDLKTYLALVSSLASKSGFVSAGQNTDWSIATYIQANQLLADYVPEQNDIEIAEKIIAHIQNLTTKSDYEERIKQIALSGSYSWQDSAYAASMYGVWLNSFRGIVSVSQFIGNVGNTIHITAKVINATEIPDSGFGISYLIILETVDKNVLTWFAKTSYKIGTILQGTAKIKSHDEWNGQNQTRIFYAKLNAL